MKKYENYTREELVAELTKLSKRKKYGLMWEEERTKEKFERDTEGKLPVLIEDKKREIKTDDDKPVNILIEGDNYHALSVLNYTHPKSIDVIYIDPPYNTGNKEDEEGFIYNDKRVEKEDTYRHSKWLSFISKRLRLAKRLLKPSGFIFISIDENEFAQLKLLCDEIFGEENFLNFIDWKKRSTGGQVKDGSIISQTEFVFIYAKNRNESKLRKLSNPNVGNEKWRDFRKSGGQWQRKYRPKQYYPFYYNEKNNYLGLNRKSKNEIEIYPLDSKGEEGFWENGIDTATERINKNEFQVSKSKSGIWKVLQLEVQGEEMNVGNFIDIPSVQGKNEVKNIGVHFNNVKPIALINFILKLSSSKDSVILDFFAGSGTTGHAVMDLNRDGGNRRFILCTNNENDICTNVCYPRVKKVMQGYKSTKGEKIKGFGGNLKYYKTDFIGSEPSHRNKKLLTQKSTEMICMKENTFKEELDKRDYFIFSNKEKYTAILFDEMKLSEFKKEISILKKPVSVYVFSLDGDDYKEEFEGLMNHITLCAVPEAILKVYRRIYVAGQLKFKLQ